MGYRTFQVTHQKDEGFKLRLVERSSFRDRVYSITDGFEAHVLRHRFCNSKPFNAIWNWADGAEQIILNISITREMADELAHEPFTWNYLDEAPMTPEESAEFFERMELAVEEYENMAWHEKVWDFFKPREKDDNGRSEESEA